MAAKPDASCLGSLERGLRPLANLLAFVLGKCGEHVHHEAVGVGIVGGNKIDAALYQAGDEVDVASKAIELGTRAAFAQAIVQASVRPAKPAA
jgi:hypothetical protein